MSETEEAEQAQSLARIEAGGIPLGAERRLRELGEGAGAFTSDLSVADFALCDQLGLRVLSQVMGSSIYQVGYQSTPWPSTMGGGFMFELNTLSDAWNEVRGNALDRLAQEAGHVGADAVVGVELRTGEHDWAENSIEYVVLGTAVRHAQSTTAVPARSDARHAQGTVAVSAGGDARHAQSKPSGGAPVLTELSVADYSKLVRAGFEPLGIVAWSSVFFVTASYSTQMMSGIGGLGFTQNQELPEFTQGIYSARESVMQRMTAQAARLHASGVIGVRIAHGIKRVQVGGGRYQQGGLMVTFHAIGTAIREDDQDGMAPPETVIDLTS
jgi:uncharacterized protein YbjQ (UPF0145 family)